MSIALKFDPSTGFMFRQFEAADLLEVQGVNPRVTTVDFTVGATLDAANKVVIGNASAETQILGFLDLDSYAEFTEAAAPATPATNDGRLYMKTGDDGIFFKPDTGVEVDLTSVGVQSLQGAYDGGQTIDMLAATGDLVIDATDAVAFQVQKGASNVIEMDVAGAVNLTPTSGQNLIGNTLGVGGVAFNSVGSGNATFFATGTGLVGLGTSGGNDIEINAAGQITLTPVAGQDLLHTVDGAAAAFEIDLLSTATFAIRDDGGGTPVMAVDGAGAVDFDPTSGQNFSITTLGSASAVFALDGSFNVAAFQGNIEFDAPLGSGHFIVDNALDLTSLSDNVNIDAELSGVVRLSHAGGTTRVLGDFIVDGTTTTVDSETVLIADNHLYLNAGYTTVATQTGGLVVNYSPIGTETTVNAAYVAGVPATSNPTVGTVGAATFAVGQFVQFSGASDSKNEGLYEVLSHAANVLTIRGIGTTATVEDFTQNQFEVVASNGATIKRLNIGVLRIGVDGIPETGEGAVTPITFNDLATAAGSDLQAAYDAGPNITIAAATPLQLTAASGVTVDPLLGIATVGAGTGAGIRLDMIAAWSGFGIDINYDVTNIAGAALKIDTDAGVGGQGILIDHNATSAQSHGLSIDTDAAVGGHGILIDHNATSALSDALNIQMDAAAQARGIAVDSAGSTGNAWLMNLENGITAMMQVKVDGSIMIDGNNGADVQVTSEGTGAMSVAALGSGLLQLFQNGTGSVLMQAAAGDVVINAQSVGDLQLQIAGADILNISASGVVLWTPTDSYTIDMDATEAYSVQVAAVEVIGISIAGALQLQALVDQNSVLEATGTGSAEVKSAASVNIAAEEDVNLDTGATFDLNYTVRGGSFTLNQSGDVTFDQVGSGEVLEGATSTVGAINRLARALDEGGQAGIKDYVVENTVTITAGDVVAQGTVASRATQADANDVLSTGSGRFVGVALETGTGDVGGTVSVRVALVGNFISDSGGAFTAGDALFMPDGTGRVTSTAPTGIGDLVKRIGWAHSATEYVIDPSVGVIL